MHDARVAQEPATIVRGRTTLQVWPLPVEETFLQGLLTDLFETYWDQIIWGPLIAGASYELTCPGKPARMDMNDGYFTVDFGGPHFHLCIGDSYGMDKANPASEHSRRERRPSEAQMFRSLDKAGAPTSWGLEMTNGKGEPMITIFFASPFANIGGIEDTPRWERLAMWRDLSLRYLGRGPDPLDESGQGFARRAA